MGLLPLKLVGKIFSATVATGFGSQLTAYHKGIKMSADFLTFLVEKKNKGEEKYFTSGGLLSALIYFSSLSPVTFQTPSDE